MTLGLSLIQLSSSFFSCSFRKIPPNTNLKLYFTDASISLFTFFRASHNRLICKQKGCGMLYTEMINAKALCYNDENTKKMTKIEDEWYYPAFRSRNTKTL